ncbi:MAG: FkbM family methyltransferase [Pseudomonadota bacterium]
MTENAIGNPLLAQMRESGLADVDIARADAMLGLLAITRKTRRRSGSDPAARALELFFEFALPRAHLSYSQIMQDLWVLFETGDKHGGYFVEFGAGNGISMSNSALLEKVKNWDGILAEPNPAFHARLGRERSGAISHACVHARTGKAETFLCTERPAFSRLATVRPDDIFERGGQRAVAREIKVPTISLNDLLGQNGAPERIDYISIDTEGSELDILSTFDFAHRQVGLFTIEHNFTPERAGIRALMQANGYLHRFPEFSRFDDWYVHCDYDRGVWRA